MTAMKPAPGVSTYLREDDGRHEFSLVRMVPCDVLSVKEPMEKSDERVIPCASESG